MTGSNFVKEILPLQLYEKFKACSEVFLNSPAVVSVIPYAFAVVAKVVVANDVAREDA